MLVDVFEKFIDTFLKYSGLDPCHYFSSLGLRWDAMLKMTDIKLEKISDIDKYLFIEKGLRRGISYISKRYAKANNNSINDYDPKKESTLITYFHMNNLYSWAFSEYLLYKRFKWLKTIDKFDIMSINDKNSIWYILEVDLEYPDELLELHNDFPLATEKFAVSNDMLSSYCEKVADTYEIKVGDVKKLIANLGNETNYLIHYKSSIFRNEID